MDGAKQVVAGRRHMRWLGMRTIKTVLAAFIAAAVMQYIFHQPPFFACIGAVVAVEKTLSRSLRAALTRNIGTITGGITGIIMASFTNNILLLSLGLIPMICIDNRIHRQDSIVIGAIVYFAVVYLNIGGGAWQYGLTRILYTFIGTLIGLGVNMLICPPKEKVDEAGE